MLTDQELADKFMASVKAKPNNTKKLFAISFLGTTGVGKTTTGKMISEKLGLYVASNDEVRRFLNEEGFPGKFPDQKLVNFIGQSVTENLYKSKTSHIIDADMIRFHKDANTNALKWGASLLIIKLVCPVETILARLEERQNKIENNGEGDYSEVGFSLSVKEEYLERTKMHDELPLPENIYFTIDTSKNVNGQVGSLIEKMCSDNYV